MTHDADEIMARKTVADLTADDLQRMAQEAYSEAARSAAAAGHVVTGFSDGSVVTGLEEARYSDASVAEVLRREPTRGVSGAKKLRRSRDSWETRHTVSLTVGVKEIPTREFTVNCRTIYRNPADPRSVPWTGRGRKPQWLRDALKRGAELSHFVAEPRSVEERRATATRTRRSPRAKAP